jgi:hypothetical protein
MGDSQLPRWKLPKKSLDANRPSDFSQRYRLYIDESGDHVFRDVESPAHRFLCLLGCWFKNADYLPFHEGLEKLKTQFLHHHPDEPVVLHREDLLHKRKAFSLLRDQAVHAAWNSQLLELVAQAHFTVVAVVIDKQALRREYGEAAAHPYHLGLGFMLQRYAGFLNHSSRVGDVMAEARGGREDRLLKESYSHVYDRGAWMVAASAFQSAFTTRELKLRTKQANIAGLQLADILGHPLKQWVLASRGHVTMPQSPFVDALLDAVKPKLNKHLYNGRFEGYGTVFYPQ